VAKVHSKFDVMHHKSKLNVAAIRDSLEITSIFTTRTTLQGTSIKVATIFYEEIALLKK